MVHLPFSFLRGKPISPLFFFFFFFFFVWILPSCSMDSPPTSSNDSAQRFSTVLRLPPPSMATSCLYLVDDSAEKSSPLLPPPSPSMDTTTLSSIDDSMEKSSSVHPAPSTDSASSYFSSVDSAEKFAVDFLSSLIAKKSFSSLSSVDDPAERSSPVLPPSSPSMDSASFSIDSAEKFTIDLLSSLVAEKSSSSVLLPPPPPPSSSSMDSTERLSTRKKKRGNGESVDEVINQWKESKSSNLSTRGGGDGFKRRTKNLGKTAKRGYMKGKGGPDNLGCKYKGVRQRTFGKWVAEIREPGGGRLVWLGTFNSARDAALAFDKAALAMYGSYAQLNIPEALNSPSEAVNSPSEAVNSPPKELSSGEMSYVDTELRLGFV